LTADAAGEGLNDDFRAVYQKWFWMGVVGFAGMFVIVLMMVTKLSPAQWLSLLG
jgi:uncharacterized membrane protein